MTRRTDLTLLHFAQMLRGAPYTRLVVAEGRIEQVFVPGRFGALTPLVGVIGNPIATVLSLVVLAFLVSRCSRTRALVLIAAFVFALAAERGCKLLLHHPEPGTVTSFYPYAAHNSYPSGHTLTAAFFATVVIALWPRRLTLWLGLASIVLVGLERMMTGNHWLSDVLGGALLGWGAAAAVFADWRGLRRHKLG